MKNATPWFRQLGLHLIVFLSVFGIPESPAVAASWLMPAKCESLLTEFTESKLTVDKAWAFTPETEQRFVAILEQNEKPESDRYRELMFAIIEARLAQSNPVTRFFMRRTIDDIFNQKSVYSRTLGRLLRPIAGPHYNPVFNRAVVTPNGRAHGIADILTAFHEVEHALDRNSNPIPWVLFAKMFPIEFFSALVRTPITPMLRYRFESRAVGAQWELANRIPEATRAELIKKIEEAKTAVQEEQTQLTQLNQEIRARHRAFKRAGAELTEKRKNLRLGLKHATIQTALLDIALQSLQNASLTKDAFLKAQLPHHNYTAEDLIESHYQFGPWRSYLLISGVIAILKLVATSDDPDDLEAGSNNIRTYDLRLMLRLYAFLLAEENAQGNPQQP